MVVKKYYVDRPKEGFQYDRKRNKYFSWGYDIWLSQARVAQRGFPTREKAEQFVTELKERYRREAHGLPVEREHTEAPYLIELFQKKLDSMRGDPKDRSRTKAIFKNFLALLPENIRVTELRKADFTAYIEKRLSDPNPRNGGTIAPATIKRELVPVLSCLNSADEFFKILEGYAPPKIPRKQLKIDRSQQKERIISKSEEAAILTYLMAPRKQEEDRRAFEGRIRTGQFFRMQLLTLTRPGELAALKWSDVNFDTGEMIIVSQKTRFKSNQVFRRLKLTPTMKAVLEERRQLSKGEFVFCPNGKVSPQMYRELKAACEANGLTYGRDDRTAISFHTTRHTAITRLLQRGVDLKTVGRLAGHSDSRMTMYYAHTQADRADAALALLDED